MTRITATTVPDERALKPWLVGADFSDAYEAPLTTAMLLPTEIILRASRSTPNWIGDLMAIRTRGTTLWPQRNFCSGSTTVTSTCAWRS